MLGAIATSVEPYYYVKSNTNGKIYKDWIKINLTTIVNVTFVYNVAPSFAEPLQNVVMSINETVVINLPEIFGSSWQNTQTNALQTPATF